jgi:CSLREA domain-containing protein
MRAENSKILELHRSKDDMGIFLELDSRRTIAIALLKRWKRMILWSFGLLFLAACSAVATDCDLSTFVVNDFFDLDDGSCDAAHCTLREAVNAANTCTLHSGYTIELPAGDYELTLRGPDTRGDLNIDRSIEIIGMGSSPADTVIRGEDTWVNSIFFVSNDGELYPTNLTIQGGNTSSNGGAIYNEGHLATDQVVFSHNRAEGDGGAIYNAGSALIDSGSLSENQALGLRSCGGGIYNSGILDVRDVEISNNEAVAGGGICNWGEASIETSNINDNSLTTYRGSGGGIYDVGSLQITGTTLRHNTAGLVGGNIAGWGGGIYSAGNDLYLTVTTITDNTASIGGGIYAGEGLDRLHLQDVQVIANHAVEFQASSSQLGGGPEPGGIGGGLALLFEGHADILDSAISNNVADLSGGGLYVDYSPGAGDPSDLITHTSIFGNVASTANGGGIYIGNGVLNITNSTISNNVGAEGLAIYVSSDGSAYLTHDTIAAHLGTAVFSEGAVYFRSSLIGDNELDCSGTRATSLQSQGWNAADDPAACHLTHVNDSIFAVSGSGFLSLRGVEAMTYGRDVATTIYMHPLLPTHPAVDFIPAAQCGIAEPVFGGTQTDQRHVDRPQGSSCDIGAYEVDVTEILSEGNLELATVTPTPGPIFATITKDARCRTGPGFVYADYDFFTPNQTTIVYARIADSSWYQVQAPTMGGKCWIGQAVLEFDVTPEVLLNLPVLQPPATPTPTVDVDEGSDGGDQGGDSGGAGSPDAPSGLQATEAKCNAVDGYKVKLTWNDNSDNESGFHIFHNGNLVATVGADMQQYTHTVPGNYAQQQSYYVEAFNNSGAAKSNTATEDGCLY